MNLHSPCAVRLRRTAHSDHNALVTLAIRGLIVRGPPASDPSCTAHQAGLADYAIFVRLQTCRVAADTKLPRHGVVTSTGRSLRRSLGAEFGNGAQIADELVLSRLNIAWVCDRLMPGLVQCIGGNGSRNFG